MAQIARNLFRSHKNFNNFGCFYRNISSARNVRSRSNLQNGVLLFIGGGLLALSHQKWKKTYTVEAANLKKLNKNENVKAVKLTARERRFIRFASVEFKGQLYMTPQDFLDSVVETEPRPRMKRRSLTESDIDKIKDSTPTLKKGSSHMFRNLWDAGIISYTEYLFLLSILTKPQSGFKIAFNMFDTDGNSRVDKNEFLIIRDIFAGSLREHDMDEATRKVLMSLVTTFEQVKILQEIERKLEAERRKQSFIEQIFSTAWFGRQPKEITTDKANEADGDGKTINKAEAEQKEKSDLEGLQTKHRIDTTILLHFFGKKGTDELIYEDFHKFMANLQTEVLELEFNEFSKGKVAITEVDFAKILLRYTHLATDEYDLYLERLLERCRTEEGITFKEFKTFCEFLNGLDDFNIAMRMYTLADQAISKHEFIRAVKICTGKELSEHLVDTVFALFDNDGDGLLSHKEFIDIMKDRRHRGFKSSGKQVGWDSFKQCLKQEMKSTTV